MKKLILLLSILIPSISNAMKIVTDEIDEFTGQRTIVTSWESFCKNNVHVRLRLQGGEELIDVKLIYDKSIVIASDDPLMLKSTSGNIAEFHPLRLYAGGIGYGAVGSIGSGMWGINATYKGDLGWFIDNCPALLRVNTTGMPIDKKLSDSEGDKLKALYILLAQTIGKNIDSPVVTNCTLKFMKKRHLQGSWDIVKEETMEYISKENLDRIIKEWNSQSSDKVIYQVQVKKEK